MSVLLVLIVAAVMAGCAKDIAPQGGPADITPPEIMLSTPLGGATNVDVRGEIVLEFTERINGKSVGNALFISPPLREEPRLRVKGSRLRIIPSAPLDSGKTYVVTLGSSVSDLNGNKLTNSLTLAFSTGDRIDSGSIGGRIFEKNKPAANFRVFAYAQRPWLTDSLFAVVPDYITESGTDGEFKFEFVKEGEYLVIGVEDKDRDNKIATYSERIAIPVATAMAVPPEIAVQPIAMHISRYDSAMIGLIACSGYEGQVVMQFSGGEIDPASVNVDSIEVQTSYFELSSPLAAVVFEKAADKLYLWSTRFVADSIVTVTAHALRGFADKKVDSSTTVCTIRIRGADTEAPELLDKPSGLTVVYPHDSLRVTFKEPVTISEGGVEIDVDSMTTVGAKAVATKAYRYSILPLDTAPYDQRLKLRIDPAAVIDLAGNVSKDSVIEMYYMVANPDSMGNLSGTINFEHEREVTVSFTGLARKIVYTHVQTANGGFALRMFPDQYIVSAFADRNRNGRWDYGSLTPFGFAEPGWVVPDTLRVRARFDTEGYDLELK
ncbi:MAG: Ig-like domain-containing protein [Candidatus Zixiibacteriota bacterium]